MKPVGPICNRCLKKPPVENRRSCRQCLIKAMVRSRRTYDQKKLAKETDALPSRIF